ncbi:tetratricopeptide repeat protein [Kitasatospora sp. NPDC015120]|uniref:tetratricopeptide repeat protein n=1 Tax=Kitasatospora sp. NPDC015120 TaxID=3364023 RepID=UPI0036F4943E
MLPAGRTHRRGDHDRGTGTRRPDGKRRLGDDHPGTLAASVNLAASCRRAGRTGEAIDLLEQVLAGARRIQDDARLHRKGPGSDGLLERLVRRAVGREWPGQGT